MSTKIEGSGNFTDPMIIGLKEALIVSGEFKGLLTIQMALEAGGRWLTVGQTAIPGRFEHVASTRWQIRAGFLEGDYHHGTAWIEIAPRPR